MKFFLIALSLLFPLCCNCQVLNNFDQTENNEMNLYKQAIQDAIYPEMSEINTNLIPIIKQNKSLVWKQINGEDYILVVSWKQNKSYYEKYLDSTFYDTGKYPIWVTTAPELLQRMQAESDTNTNHRLKQLLGLPPNATYNYFIEFWVKPEDLFRPCPDKEIADQRCDICFPAKTDSSHILWINTNRIERYYQCELYQQYPWTQLGYTYDWNPKNESHFGLSEFIIGTSKKIKVASIYTTEEYLKKTY